MLTKRSHIARHRRWPWLWLTVGITALLATSVACGAPSGATHTSNQLVWGKAVEPSYLDPAVAGGASSWDLQSLTYEGLVGLDGNLRPVPLLAESWTQTSPTTYVFKLRKGVKFSNGREMTSDDVVGSLQRMIDPKLKSLWAAQVGISSIVARDDGSVEISLLKPKVSFLAALAGMPASVLPMKELRDGSFDPKKTLLGTGPFEETAHVPNQSWTFVRNPFYWAPGLPKADRLTVRIMTDDAARSAALRDGSVDVATFDVPDAVQLLKSQPKVTTVTQATTDFYRLDVNTKSSLFQDPRLRAALALSIDRNEVKDVALGGSGRPTAAASVAFDGGCTPGAVPFALPDAQQAQDLVRSAGAVGKTVEILTPTSVPMSAPIAQVLQQKLQAAGLNVRIVSVDNGQLTQRAYSNSVNFDLVVSYFPGYADPGMALVGWNPDISSFDKAWATSDAQLNDLIDRSLATAPGPERTQVLQDACARIAQDTTIVPLVTKDTFVAYRSDKVSVVLPRVEGYAVPLRDIAQFQAK